MAWGSGTVGDGLRARQRGQESARLAEQLRTAAEAVRLAERGVVLAVTEARTAGFTDDWIAGTLGVSAAAMRRRYTGRNAARRVLGAAR